MVTFYKDRPQLPLWQRGVKALHKWRLACFGTMAFLFLIRRHVSSINWNWWDGADSLRSLEWVHRYEEDGRFPFSLQNSEECATLLDDPSGLKYVAVVAVKDWTQRQEDPHLPLSSTMEQASQTWHKAMQACHGALPSSVESELTLRSFADGFAKCGDPQAIQKGGLAELFGGEWCVNDWRQYLRPAFQAWGFSSTLYDKFVDSARCALHLEFPLTPSTTTISSNQRRPPNWQPTRTILLALTMGKAGATMACKLVTTAYPRGWDVVLVEGNYMGYKYKYTYALKALKVLLEASDVPASETLVVFADAKDVLVQASPALIVRAFQHQPHDFVFSSEPLCFPLGTWPHSLGVPHHTCQALYPESSSTGGSAIVPGQKFVNTGGWIGLASSAVVVLKEMVLTVQHRPRDAVCHSWGTDQLLGNAAFLRHPSLLGLDTDYAVFASGAWGLVEDNVLQYNKVEKAYCSSGNNCPGMLHFNGGGDEGGSFQKAYEVLTSKDSLPTCSKGGTVSVVNIDTEQIRKLPHHRAKGTNFGPIWHSCLKDKPCFGVS